MDCMAEARVAADWAASAARTAASVAAVLWVAVLRLACDRHTAVCGPVCVGG